jgi:hypothetical protein
MAHRRSVTSLLGIEWNPEVILATAALLTAAAGVMSAWAALRRHGRNVKATAEDECRERLRLARAEAESVAQELHDVKMEKLR